MTNEKTQLDTMYKVTLPTFRDAPALLRIFMKQNNVTTLCRNGDGETTSYECINLATLEEMARQWWAMGTGDYKIMARQAEHTSKVKTVTRKDMETKQTELLKHYGAFFAFSNKQFNEQKQAGVKYVSVGSSGMITPKGTTVELLAALESSHSEFTASEVAIHGKKKIIHRELANYECQISGDTEDAVNTLEAYGITEAEVAAEWGAYMKYCNENDCF